MMEKNQFLSIGEVSRIMDVNIKNLRYYDAIGALTPAYVDPDTGYRYYAPSQLGMIQAIRFCVELGIPLKQFSHYCSGSSIDAVRLMEDAGKMAEQKIQAIHEGLRFVEEMREAVRRGDRLMVSSEPLEYEITARRYIVRAIQNQYSDLDFNKTLGRLHFEAVELGFRTGFYYGFLYTYKGGVCQRYVFTEVFGEGDADESVLSFPAGRCRSVLCRMSRIEEAEELFPAEFASGESLALFESEVITGVYDTAKPCYELRCRRM